jgi:hypothetical protein
MIWNLDSMWLMMAIATVVVLSYFFGTALNALMHDDGFGANGNAVIVASGFFLTIFGANYQGYDLHDMHQAIIVGLAGAFVVLASLTLVRALVRLL